MVVFSLNLAQVYIRGNGSHSHTLLGSLPLAHNAEHSLVYIFIYIVRPTVLAPGWPRATRKRSRPDRESSQSS